MIEKLTKLDILNGPDICSCGNKQFRLQKLSSIMLVLDVNKRLKNRKKRYSVNTNSFFKDFPKSKVEDIYEIIKCNLFLHFNKGKTKEYVFNEKK